MVFYHAKDSIVIIPNMFNYLINRWSIWGARLRCGKLQLGMGFIYWNPFSKRNFFLQISMYQTRVFPFIVEFLVPSLLPISIKIRLEIILFVRFLVDKWEI